MHGCGAVVRSDSCADDSPESAAAQDGAHLEAGRGTGGVASVPWLAAQSDPPNQVILVRLRTEGCIQFQAHLG